MKCNTWEAERRNAILSVYGKTIQSPNLVRNGNGVRLEINGVRLALLHY